jgi:hypothetical protein
MRTRTVSTALFPQNAFNAFYDHRFLEVQRDGSGKAQSLEGAKSSHYSINYARRTDPQSSNLVSRQPRLINLLRCRHRPGTLRKNVALVQKSSKTSVEQSFFAGCPCFGCS